MDSRVDRNFIQTAFYYDSHIAGLSFPIAPVNQDAYRISNLVFGWDEYATIFPIERERYFTRKWPEDHGMSRRRYLANLPDPNRYWGIHIYLNPCQWQQMRYDPKDHPNPKKHAVWNPDEFEALLHQSDGVIAKLQAIEDSGWTYTNALSKCIIEEFMRFIKGSHNSQIAEHFFRTSKSSDAIASLMVKQWVDWGHMDWKRLTPPPKNPQKGEKTIRKFL